MSVFYILEISRGEALLLRDMYDMHGYVLMQIKNAYIALRKQDGCFDKS